MNQISYTKQICRGITAMICSLVIFGCTKDDTSWSANPDLVNYNDVDVSLDQSKQIPEQIQQLAAAINQDKSVSFRKVTNQIVSDHVAEYNRLENASIDTNSTLVTLQEMANVSKDKANMSEAKVAYESKIEDQIKATIKYNKAKVSLVHPIKDARLQCYSGSMLNMVLNRIATEGTSYRDQNYVLVFTDGHVFPGKMQRIGDEKSPVRQRGQWELLGVETTAAGGAQIAPILASRIPSDVHVIDAEYVSLVEIFKPYLEPATSSDFAYSLRKLTANKYGIQLPSKKEAAASAIAKLTRNSLIKPQSKTGLNASPLAIGISDVEDGDIARTENVGIGSSPFVVIGNTRYLGKTWFGQESEEPFPPEYAEKMQYMGFTGILSNYSAYYCKLIEPLPSVENSGPDDKDISKASMILDMKDSTVTISICKSYSYYLSWEKEPACHSLSIDERSYTDPSQVFVEIVEPTVNDAGDLLASKLRLSNPDAGYDVKMNVSPAVASRRSRPKIEVDVTLADREGDSDEVTQVAGRYIFNCFLDRKKRPNDQKEPSLNESATKAASF